MGFDVIISHALVSIRNGRAARMAGRILAVFVAFWLVVPVASGQSLVERYKAAYFKKQTERIFQQYGLRVQPRPMAHVPSDADTVRAWIAQFNPDVMPIEASVVLPPPRFDVVSWKLVRKLERPWFEREFSRTRWAYVGSNRITTLDTLFTRELRARLEARFGAPTMTLTEVDFREDLRREEYIEFEYWFVLNDSIPLKVMDVNGPFERGLVVAGDQRYRDLLHDIKYAFLTDVAQSAEQAPYVDYYYNVDRGAWYRTGFDGQRYFLTQIARPNLARGRPYLPSDRSNNRTSTNK